LSRPEGSGRRRKGLGWRRRRRAIEIERRIRETRRLRRRRIEIERRETRRWGGPGCTAG